MRSSRVSLHTSFVLSPLPGCFTTNTAQSRRLSLLIMVRDENGLVTDNILRSFNSAQMIFKPSKYSVCPITYQRGNDFALTARALSCLTYKLVSLSPIPSNIPGCISNKSLCDRSLQIGKDIERYKWLYKVNFGMSKCF